ncbi:hypothetical protein C9974_12210 [Marinobacter sp. B9-2]|nr:hypothetical protein C9974_12210 [Marinobacter sp. B9-2]
MKLGIVIPLKSKKVSKDWRLTCDNLQATVNSIINQKQSDFNVLIVGHERPEFLSDEPYRSKKIFFEELTELTPPNSQTDKIKNQLLFEKDRCSKILKGVNSLRKSDPEINYWFPLDADDLIHRNFVSEIYEIISKNEYDFIVLNRGYIFYKSSNTFIKENNFSLYCGSSAIVKDHLIPNHANIADNSYRDFIFGQIPHTQMLEYAKENKMSLHVPEKHIVMYCKDHGENISDETRPTNLWYSIKRNLKIKLKKIYLTKDINKAFFFETGN